MGYMFFHCSSNEGVLLDRHGSFVEDLIEAKEKAARVVMAFLGTPGAEDWRKWHLHVRYEEGEEIFTIAFASILGKPH